MSKKGKGKFSLIVQVKRLQGGNDLFALKSRGAGERTSGEVSGE